MSKASRPAPQNEPGLLEGDRMLTRHKRTFTGLAAILLAAGTGVGTAVAREGDTPRPQDKVALGEDEVKQLVLLMDQNKNGKVSEQEFMNFMRAEFRRL